MTQVYLGTSGFSLQQFYPEKLPNSQKLNFYTQIFNSVEINSTFYHIPRLTTLRNWQQYVPESFIFAFKVHQSITHTKKVDPELLKDWFQRFEIFAFQKPKHLMLFQYAATHKPDLKEFQKLLDNLPATFLYAFEFRHQDWFNEEILKKMNGDNMGVVLADSPVKKSGEYLWPKIDFPNGPFLYLRFHGAEDLYRSSYSDEQLQKYASLIKLKIAKGKNAYIYFNNDAKGYAAKNAQTLQKLLSV